MNTLEKLAQVNKAARYVARQRLIKKADLDTEIEKAKRLRDSSLTDDLLWQALTSGVAVGLGGGIGGALGGGARGFIDSTRPNPIGVAPYSWVPVSPAKEVTVGDMDHVKVTVPTPRSFDKAYDLYGSVGFLNGMSKNLKDGAIKGFGLGAGIGALYSLLTYYSRKAKAEKKLKELGIE